MNNSLITQITRFLILVMLIGSAYGFINHSSKTKVINLADVLNDPSYHAEITSIGGHSGKCVSLKLNPTQTFKLNVPEGTLFYPADEGEQTLMAPMAKNYEIRRNTPRTIKLAAYCTEASDRSPSSGKGFKLGITKDTALKQLTQFFKRNRVHDQGAIQEAIWCITDNESIANVYLEDTAKNRTLKELLGALTQRKIPWHSARRTITHDDFGNISTSTTKVFGDISFINPKPITIQSKVVDSSGNIKFTNGKSHQIPIADNVSLKFEVTVQGWKKGKYNVIYYTSEGTEILNKEFVL